VTFALLLLGPDHHEVGEGEHAAEEHEGAGRAGEEILDPAAGWGDGGQDDGG
jgi:hypothetical protein